MSSRESTEIPGGTIDVASLLLTDLHSHILPGIDDGARNVKDSLAMLRLLRDLGYRKVVTTPHVMMEVYSNTIRTIREAEARLRSSDGFEALGVSLQVAAEYMLDEGFGRLLESGELLPLGEAWVLVECSFLQPWPGYRELIFELQLQGYTPVLAHPERYPYWLTDPRGLDALSDAGVLFQVNLMSLAGRYGPKIKKQADRLLRDGRVSFLGSDLHTVSTAADLIQGLESVSARTYAATMLNAKL